jgi:hypothetical protein
MRKIPQADTYTSPSLGLEVPAEPIAQGYTRGEVLSINKRRSDPVHAFAMVFPLGNVGVGGSVRNVVCAPASANKNFRARSTDMPAVWLSLECSERTFFCLTIRLHA